MGCWTRPPTKAHKEAPSWRFTEQQSPVGWGTHWPPPSSRGLAADVSAESHCFSKKPEGEREGERQAPFYRGFPLQTQSSGRCPWPVCPSLCPTASLSQELALRLSTKAPCYGGFEAEVPISRLITELIRQLGDSCWGGLWGPGTAPNTSPAPRHTSAHPSKRGLASGPACVPVCRAAEDPSGERRDTATPRSSPGGGLMDSLARSALGGSR